MSGISLTTKELLVLSARLDADAFYGVGDPFGDMTATEIWAQIPDILEQAADDGLISLGFDDKVTMKPELKELLEPCIHCTSYTTVDCARCGVQQPGRVLYQGGSRDVLLHREDRMTLELTHAADLRTALKQEFFSSLPCPHEAPFTMDRSLLEQARQADPSGAVKLLREADCPQAIAQALEQNLHGCSLSLSLTRSDFNAHTCIPFMCLLSEQGALHVELWYDLEGEHLTFTWLDTDALERQLVSCLPGEEVQP